MVEVKMYFIIVDVVGVIKMKKINIWLLECKCGVFLKDLFGVICMGVKDEDFFLFFVNCFSCLDK